MATGGACEAVPRYAMIARVLRDEIGGGVHPVGVRLPTEAELCARFGVSRHTVREALRLLREERLITSRRGAGSEVAMPAGAEAFRLEASSIDDLMLYAANMHTEIRSTGTERVDGRAATQLGIAGGREWLAVRGLVRLRRRPTPVCWSEYFIHADFAGIAAHLPRNAGPIVLLIEETYGIRVAQVDQTISTGSLGRPIALELGGEPGEPAIEVRRSYRTAEGRLAQVSLHVHRASRFQQTIRMRRLKG